MISLGSGKVRTKDRRPRRPFRLLNEPQLKPDREAALAREEFGAVNAISRRGDGRSPHHQLLTVGTAAPTILPTLLRCVHRTISK
jgi:hypothetical protein